MDNLTFRVFVFFLLVGISFLCAYGVGRLVGYDLFYGLYSGEFDTLSAQFLAISIAFPIIFFMIGYLQLLPALIVSFLLAVASAVFIVAKTDMSVIFGYIPPFVVFAVLYCFLALLLKWVWMNPEIRVLKGLRFSLMSAAAYCILLIAMHAVGREGLTGFVVAQYFYFSLIVFISETVAISIAERIYIPLAIKWKVPDFMPDEAPASEEDADKEDN
jgi:hypothetical protein